MRVNPESQSTGRRFEIGKLELRADKSPKAAGVVGFGERRPPGEAEAPVCLAKHTGIFVSVTIASGGRPLDRALPPYSWGAGQSRLVDMLMSGHPAKDGEARVKLDGESLDRIVTWIDLNTPYYPSHVTYYGSNTAGRSPLDHMDLAKLGRLIRESPHGAQYGWSKVNEYKCEQIGGVMWKHGSPVSFTRPETSLCLTGFGSRQSPDYQDALALIRKGARNLGVHPRLDMPGFKPCAADQSRLDFLAERQQIERLNRQARIRGDKLMDR